MSSSARSPVLGLTPELSRPAQRGTSLPETAKGARLERIVRRPSTWLLARVWIADTPARLCSIPFFVAIDYKLQVVNFAVFQLH